MAKIKINVTGHLFTVTEFPLITDNNVNVDEIEAEFDESWDGYAKIAVFKKKSWQNSLCTLFDCNNIAKLPDTVGSGKLILGIVGIDSESQITTNIKTISIAESAEFDGIEAPEEDVYRQILDSYARVINQRSEIDAEIHRVEAQANANYETVNERVNNLVATDPGSTGDNAELLDIRVGSDGKVYSTAGEAVRVQVSELKSDLTRLNDGGLILKDDVIAENVTDWLDEHPEATTTVQDHSLTIDKMIVGTLGYVTPEMFGAIGDGVSDDTNAFKQAINFITNKIVETQTMYNMVILKITNGVYKITETININPYIKVVADGNVAIDFYGENSLFNYVALKINNDNENAQQDYQSGVMFDGNGLVLRNKSNSDHADAFYFDMPIETKKTTIARTVFKNVKIKNFAHGLHIFMKNFYMVTFENFNFQDCLCCVRFDASNGSLPYNAGERIIFNNCLFNGTTALLVNTTGIEVYFNRCSFDFLNGLLNSLMTGYNNFNFSKCHIEKISNFITQGNVGPYYNNTIFDKCLFLLENTHLFKHSDRMTIKNSTFNFTSEIELTALNMFIGDREVSLINNHISNRYFYGSFLNSSPFFDRDEIIEGLTLPYDTKNFTVKDVANVKTANIVSGGIVKCLRLTATSSGEQKTMLSLKSAITVKNKELNVNVLFDENCKSVTFDYILYDDNNNSFVKSEKFTEFINDGKYFSIDKDVLSIPSYVSKIKVNATFDFGEKVVGDVMEIYGFIIQ